MSYDYAKPLDPSVRRLMFVIGALWFGFWIATAYVCLPILGFTHQMTLIFSLPVGCILAGILAVIGILLIDLAGGITAPPSIT